MAKVDQILKGDDNLPRIIEVICDTSYDVLAKDIELLTTKFGQIDSKSIYLLGSLAYFANLSLTTIIHVLQEKVNWHSYNWLREPAALIYFISLVLGAILAVIAIVPQPMRSVFPDSQQEDIIKASMKSEQEGKVEFCNHLLWVRHKLVEQVNQKSQFLCGSFACTLIFVITAISLDL